MAHRIVDELREASDIEKKLLREYIVTCENKIVEMESSQIDLFRARIELQTMNNLLQASEKEKEELQKICDAVQYGCGPNFFGGSPMSGYSEASPESSNIASTGKAELKAMMSEFEHEVLELPTDEAAAEMDKPHLLAHFSKASSAVRTLEKTLDALKKKLESIHKEKVKKMEEIFNLKRENGNLQSMVSRVRGELDDERKSKKKQFEQMMKEVKESREKLADGEKRTRIEQNHIKEKHAREFGALTKTNQSLSYEVERLKNIERKCGDLENRMQVQSERVNTMTEEQAVAANLAGQKFSAFLLHVKRMFSDILGCFEVLPIQLNLPLQSKEMLATPEVPSIPLSHIDPHLNSQKSDILSALRIVLKMLAPNVEKARASVKEQMAFICSVKAKQTEIDKLLLQLRDHLTADVKAVVKESTLNDAQLEKTRKEIRSAFAEPHQEEALSLLTPETDDRFALSPSKEEEDQREIPNEHPRAPESAEDKDKKSVQQSVSERQPSPEQPAVEATVPTSRIPENQEVEKVIVTPKEPENDKVSSEDPIIEISSKGKEEDGAEEFQIAVGDKLLSPVEVEGQVSGFFEPPLVIDTVEIRVVPPPEKKAECHPDQESMDTLVANADASSPQSVIPKQEVPIEKQLEVTKNVPPHHVDAAKSTIPAPFQPSVTKSEDVSEVKVATNELSSENVTETEVSSEVIVEEPVKKPADPPSAAPIVPPQPMKGESGLAYTSQYAPVLDALDTMHEQSNENLRKLELDLREVRVQNLDACAEALKASRAIHMKLHGANSLVGLDDILLDPNQPFGMPQQHQLVERVVGGKVKGKVIKQNANIASQQQAAKQRLTKQKQKGAPDLHLGK